MYPFTLIYKVKRLKVICTFVGLAALFAVSPANAADESRTENPDSIHTSAPKSEYTHIFKTKKTSSPYPVKIETKGSALLVTSRHTQMLPIYKENGVFYGLFRIDKGTNWINGLPKGIYLINNYKVKVS